MSLGDELNKWLIEQGEEPISPELIETINKAIPRAQDESNGPQRVLWFGSGRN